MTNECLSRACAIAFALTLSLLCGCKKGQSYSSESPTVPLQTMREITNAVGKFVTVQGIAQNAKLGAIVMVEDLPIYIADLDAWTNRTGKPISITGTIKTYVAQGRTNEFGLVSGGIDRLIYILENPQYSDRK
jgi:hypothetical protein